MASLRYQQFSNAVISHVSLTIEDSHHIFSDGGDTANDIKTHCGLFLTNAESPSVFNCFSESESRWLTHDCHADEMECYDGAIQGA